MRLPENVCFLGRDCSNFEVIQAKAFKGGEADEQARGHHDVLRIVTEMSRAPVTDQSLVKLHYHVMNLSTNLALAEAQWSDAVDEAAKLEELIGFQVRKVLNGTQNACHCYLFLFAQKSPASAPRWSHGFRMAFVWRWKVSISRIYCFISLSSRVLFFSQVFWEPYVFKFLAIIFGLLSLFFAWTEMVMLSPTDLNPIKNMVQGVK
jgi:hypothetical protein